MEPSAMEESTAPVASREASGTELPPSGETSSGVPESPSGGAPSAVEEAEPLSRGGVADDTWLPHAVSGPRSANASGRRYPIIALSHSDGDHPRLRGGCSRR